MDLQATYWIVAIAVNAIGAFVTVGTLIWKLGVLHATVKSIQDWMRDLAAGKAPVCAAHGEQLLNLDRRVTSIEERGARDQVTGAREKATKRKAES